MLTEKNFSAALKAMNFVECGNFFEKTFAGNVIMRADLPNKKLFYPAQIMLKNRPQTEILQPKGLKSFRN